MAKYLNNKGRTTLFRTDGYYWRLEGEHCVFGFLFYEEDGKPKYLFESAPHTDGLMKPERSFWHGIQAQVSGSTEIKNTQKIEIVDAQQIEIESGSLYTENGKTIKYKSGDEIKEYEFFEFTFEE